MVQVQSENECVLGGRLLKLSPSLASVPLSSPPPCHSPSATLRLPAPPPTLSSSLHLCAAAAAAAGCAIPDPDFCTGQGALTPASETLLQLLQTCHRKSQVKKDSNSPHSSSILSCLTPTCPNPLL